ncbi:MAG: DUF4282 domain-containing protein [Pseudomonadota bacterium]
MDFLSRLLSFERSMAPVLVQLLYYIGLVWTTWVCIARMIAGFVDLGGGNVGDAIWQIVSAPLIALLSVFFLRVLAEAARALFRVDASLHDIVTGRAAPSAATRQPSPDQSPD